MKIKIVTVSDQPNNPGLKQLVRSLEHFGYDYHVIPAVWRWFGTKIIETAAYLRTLPEDYTHVLFTDAHDTFFIGGPAEFNDKLYSQAHAWVSAEKACWPDPNVAERYTHTNRSEWKYVNSGQYLFPIPLFLQVVEENPIKYTDDDQRWLTSVYLSGKYDILLDANCRLFQSIAFQSADDFTVNAAGRVRNRKQLSTPIAIHGNGKTNMEWIYNLLP